MPAWSKAASQNATLYFHYCEGVSTRRDGRAGNSWYHQGLHGSKVLSSPHHEQVQLCEVFSSMNAAARIDGAPSIWMSTVPARDIVS